MAWLLMMIGAALACYGFSGGIKGLICSMARRKDLCRVILKYGEREETVTGLIDTGNRLRGPVSGQPVHVATAGLMTRLCPAVKGVVSVSYTHLDVYKRQAEGETLINDCQHIERGYEDICRDMAALGADIRWLDK